VAQGSLPTDPNSTPLPLQLLAGPAVLHFETVVGASPPPADVYLVSSKPEPLSWTASADVAWLAVTPATGSTPATLSVAVNSAGLTVGDYAGAIQVTAAQGGVQTVTVHLTVRASAGPPTVVYLPLVDR
jgi:hypothetical protein